jgi:hypothetical protein
VVARSAESKARAREGCAAAIVDEIASLPRLDGAVVATSTSSHAVVLDELLALDVPALCEKPLPSVPRERLGSEGNVRSAGGADRDATLAACSANGSAGERTLRYALRRRVARAVSRPAGATLSRPRRRSSAGRALHS